MFSRCKIPLKRQDKNDLINNIVGQISSLTKSVAANKRNYGNVLKVMLKDGGISLENRKGINMQFIDSECEVNSTFRGASCKRIEKNFIKQGGEKQKQRGKI